MNGAESARAERAELKAVVRDAVMAGRSHIEGLPCPACDPRVEAVLAAVDAYVAAQDSRPAPELAAQRDALQEIERLTDWAVNNDDDTLSIEHVRDLARRGLQGEPKAGWEGIAQSGITAGGWDALAAEIESLAPGDGVTTGSTILAQVCRAVAARLTGNRPKGEVSVWIDDEGDGDAKVTVAWGAPRLAEKASRGENAGEEPWFPGGDPRDDGWTGGYRPGIEGD